MAGRPNTLPWNFATFTGNEPVTTLSDNFNSLNAQVNDSGAGWTSYATDTGSANNYAVTLTSAPLAYEAGMKVVFNPANNNTGASVINVNSLGNVAIVNPANIALSGGEISKSAVVPLVFDGTSFRIIGSCALAKQPGTQSSGLILECAGYTSVFINAAYSVGGLATTFNHVSYGAFIQLIITNVSGGSGNYSIAMNDPAGTAASSVIAALYGVSTGSGFSDIKSGTGFFTLSNNASAVLTGRLDPGPSGHFGR